MHSAHIVLLLPRSTLEHDRYVVDPDNGHVWVAASPDRSISFADMEFALTLTALTIFHDGGADEHPQRAEQLIASAEAFDCLLGYDPAPRRHSLNVIMASGSSDDDPLIPTSNATHTDFSPQRNHTPCSPKPIPLLPTT